MNQPLHYGIFDHKQMYAEVKVAYRLSELGMLLDPDETPEKRDMEEVDAEYDYWLTEHTRQAKESAWDEGHEDGAWNTHNALAIEHLIKTKITNPYRSQT